MNYCIQSMVTGMKFHGDLDGVTAWIQANLTSHTPFARKMFCNLVSALEEGQRCTFDDWSVARVDALKSIVGASIKLAEVVDGHLRLWLSGGSILDVPLDENEKMSLTNGG